MADGTMPVVEQDELSEKDLVDLFHHDPLDVGDAGGDEAEAAEAAEADAAPEQTEAEAADPGAAPQLQEQQASNVDLPNQIAEAVRDAIKPPTAEAAPADALPDYMYTIPPQLQQMMEAEDPAQRAKGYAHLISGALRIAHQTILAEVTKQIASVRTEIPATINQQQQTVAAQRGVFDDFYSAHEDLKNPALGQFIYQQAMALSQEKPQLIAGGWNPRFRDALAERVRGILKWQAPQGQTQQPRGTRPPRMLNGGARPGTENLVGQDKHLADIFGR